MHDPHDCSWGDRFWSLSHSKQNSYGNGGVGRYDSGTTGNYPVYHTPHLCFGWLLHGCLVIHNHYQFTTFYAQSNERGDEPRFVSSGQVQSPSAVVSLSDQAWPWVCDWEDDGDLDLLVGGGYGWPRILINHGTKERMAAWREVARRIAHEVKNPLTPIKLSAQRLRRKYGDQITGDNGVFMECTQTIIDQSDQLRNLVNEFSSFARLPAVNPEPSELKEIVENAVALYREAQPQISFKVDGSPDVPQLNLDKQQMK